MKKEVRVLIVDDYKMVRDGIRSMLEYHDNKFRFYIFEAEDGEEGVELTKQNRYDVIILDYQLPGMDGPDTARMILQHAPEAKILAMSHYNEYMYIDRMMKSGAKGFVLKNVTPEELVKAVETILGGKNYYSNDVAVKLLSFENDTREDFRYSSGNGHSKIYTKLSARELEVLKLVGEALTNDEIAEQLDISVRTVESHKSHIFNKMDICNSAGLMKLALEVLH